MPVPSRCAANWIFARSHVTRRWRSCPVQGNAEPCHSCRGAIATRKGGDQAPCSASVGGAGALPGRRPHAHQRTGATRVPRAPPAGRNALPSGPSALARVQRRGSRQIPWSQWRSVPGCSWRACGSRVFAAVAGRGARSDGRLWSGWRPCSVKGRRWRCWHGARSFCWLFSDPTTRRGYETGTPGIPQDPAGIPGCGEGRRSIRSSAASAAARSGPRRTSRCSMRSS
jgi:hypothetical protein